MKFEMYLLILYLICMFFSGNMQFTDWAVRKLPYCPQSHALFVNYYYYYICIIILYM